MSATDPARSIEATITLTKGSVALVPAHLSFIKIKMTGHDCCFPHPQTAKLTNTSNSPLAVTGITIGGTNADAFSQTNTCDDYISAGSSCEITVKVAKILAIGNYTAVLSIDDSSTDSPQKLQLSVSVRQAMTATMRAILAGQTSAATPIPSGDRLVGTSLLHLTDSKRPDPYLSNGLAREIMVRLWYPTIATTCKPAEYTSFQVWNYFATLIDTPLPQVSTHSCLDSPIAEGIFPVVLITHGFTGTFTDYTFLAEDLASRGYVVASVAHTYESTAVQFPDGRLAESVFGSYLTDFTRNDEGALAMAVSIRLVDLRFVLDELQRLNTEGNSGFNAKLDLAHVALVGHSLGGLTTVRAMQSEPRLRVGILLDAVIPPHLTVPIHQPMMTLVAGRTRWNEDDCRLWNDLGGPRLGINLPTVEHMALSDAAWLFRGSVHTGNAGPDVAIAAIRRLVATFLDENLKGRNRAAAPTYPLASTPGVLIATQTKSLCGKQIAESDWWQID
jgi:dienelactone hydrolase